MIITSVNQRSPHKLGEMNDHKLVPLLRSKGLEASIGHGLVNIQTDGFRSVATVIDALDEMGLEYSLVGIDEVVESIAHDLMSAAEWESNPAKPWISAARSEPRIRRSVLTAYKIYDRVVRSTQYQ